MDTFNLLDAQVRVLVENVLLVEFVRKTLGPAREHSPSPSRE
jgi:hypothetical protein